MVFTGIQTQGYYRLINNLNRAGNSIYDYKLELKRVPRQTAQIAEPYQGGKYSLKFVVLHCADEAESGERNEYLFGKLISYQE